MAQTLRPVRRRAAAFAFLVTRMTVRHDLGVAYRALWICLPVLALGVLSRFAIVAMTQIF
jgi:hypothetical protein